MKLINPSDLAKVIHILTQSFQTNPSALWVIKQDGKVQKRLEALIEYAVKTGLENNGVFLSDDESAAAICFEEPAKSSLNSYWNQVQLIRKAIGISRVPQVLKREGYLKKQRPNEPYLNFWFLGVDPEKKGTGGVYDLKEGIFRLSQEKELPILLETSVERNRNVYERFGFHVYHTWQESDDYTLWFMRRD
ncbi:hypothetical protein [Ekhidna sp. To15]|uniref:hypothetical protein n=1 Tax=Ekhidna sp. To15 TaxID=3395267 RepID=UPI003F528279